VCIVLLLVVRQRGRALRDGHVGAYPFSSVV
jgi:hypothetical protein